MDENVIISTPAKFKQLKKIFKEQGKDKIHILADFDRTLTKAFVNGEKISSIISILRKENYLDDEYSQITSELFNKYHPIEIDSRLPIAEKKIKMAEWWRLHNAELVKHGLNKKHLAKVVASSRIKFRKGSLEFIDILYKNDIPLVIMSSSGLGNFTISQLLDKQNRLYNNIHIISNRMEFDAAGKVIAFKEPVIHVLNKDETVVRDFPEIFVRIKEKKNVILLGDNIEDIGMIEGFDYDNLLKIGFLNYEIEKNLEQYKQNYDIVILNDGDIDFINQFLNDLI